MTPLHPLSNHSNTIHLGTYYLFGQSPDDTLQLKPGVSLFGGFASDEKVRGQRDSAAHPALLSGCDSADCGQRVYHVLTGSNGSVIDGFTIAHGQASGEGARQHGGGLYNEGTSPEVVNCLFVDNQASQLDGAIYNEKGAPLIKDTVFLSNQAMGMGGAFATAANLPQSSCRDAGSSPIARRMEARSPSAARNPPLR